MLKVDKNNMINIIIDDIQLLVNKNTTIIQACLILKDKLKQSDNEDKTGIPRFCFHQELEIAGNCRMCLVELVKSPKPVVACALQVSDNMIIKTDTILVKKAREGVLEFFLINHPLDCPVCDQGGECDLQDQVDVFGIDKSRFNEFKRAIVYKSCSPFVKMIMTRCIHCTRCIRFLIDISGVHNFCLTGRGNMMEVGNFIYKYLKSELSGNVIDLCPVGALTSKATTYKMREWELTKKETIDIFDNMGADIRVDLRGTKIMRILPRLNKDVNNNWITDLTRFCFDALSIQRYILPYYREDKKYNKNNLLLPTNWSIILDKFWKHYYINKYILKKDLNLSFVGGGATDVYTGLTIKKFSNILGSSSHEGRFENNNFLNLDFRQYYILNLNKNDFENINVFIFLGINLRLEAPLYNIKLRKLKKKKDILIISFSSTSNLLYYVKHVSINIKNFLKFLEGKHYLTNFIVNNFKISYNDLSFFFIIGSSILRRNDGAAFIQAINCYTNLYNKKASFGIVQTNIGRITTSEIGLSKGVSHYNNNNNFNYYNNNFFKNGLKYSFLFACDDYDNWKNLKIKNNTFNVYIGSQSFDFTNYMHIVLPATHHFEKSAYYLNLEGVVRKGQEIINLLEQTQYDWRIIFLLYLKIMKSINYLKYFNMEFFDICLKNNYIFINFFFFYKKEFWLKKLNNIMLNIKGNMFIKKWKKRKNKRAKIKIHFWLINTWLEDTIYRNNITTSVFFFSCFKNNKKNLLLALKNKYINFFNFIYKIKIININFIYNLYLKHNLYIKYLKILLIKLGKNLSIRFFLMHIKYNSYKLLDIIDLVFSSIENIDFFNSCRYIFLPKCRLLKKRPKLFYIKSYLKSFILNKSSFYFDKFIIFNFLFKFYFISVFSNISKNFFKIKNLYLFNTKFLYFILILICRILNINIKNQRSLYLYLCNMIKEVNYINFNKQFINYFFNDYKYDNIQRNAVFYVNNIEVSISENLKKYTKLFLNHNQYFILYNKMYDKRNLNKLNTINNKQIILNNYPILSYINNYLDSNKISSLSVRIRSSFLISKYKIYFSNYL